MVRLHSAASEAPGSRGISLLNYEPVGTRSIPIGLQAAGQTQTVSALDFGSTGCGAATAASLRIVIVEFG